MKARAAKGSFVEGCRGVGFFRIVDIDADDGADIDRRGQIIDDGVEEEPHALVLVGGAAENRGDEHLDGGFARGFFQQFCRDVLAVEIEFHDLFIKIGHLFDQMVPRLFGLCLVGLGNIGLNRRFHVLDEDGLSLNDVDAALEILLAADRHLEWDRVGVKVFVHLVNDFVEVGADAVHLVDEGDPRHLVAVSLVPDGLALGFDARRRRRRPRSCRR